eukprot:scaffold416_cov329-Pavlova_lutheri.AAC.13
MRRTARLVAQSGELLRKVQFWLEGVLKDGYPLHASPQRILEDFQVKQGTRLLVLGLLPETPEDVKAATLLDGHLRQVGVHLGPPFLEPVEYSSVSTNRHDVRVLEQTGLGRIGGDVLRGRALGHLSSCHRHLKPGIVCATLQEVVPFVQKVFEVLARTGRNVNSQQVPPDLEVETKVLIDALDGMHGERSVVPKRWCCVHVARYLFSSVEFNLTCNTFSIRDCKNFNHLERRICTPLLCEVVHKTSYFHVAVAVLSCGK